MACFILHSYRFNWWDGVPEMIYVPNYTQNTCCYMYDSNTLRCYDYRPTYNTTVNYIDYFVNSHYLERYGSTQFSSYSSNIQCLDSSKFTQAYFYRNDAADIMILFMLIAIFILFIGKTFLRTFFRGFFR